MYGAYPGQYGQYPGGPGGAPPGMAPGTGIGAAPGLPSQHQDNNNASRPYNYQSMPMPMPNINFAAPVIRLGAQKEPGTVDRAPRRPEQRERPAPIQPQTKEEIIKTLFVGGIPESLSDERLERILRAAGSVRRWFRATDAEEKPCRFGFAEYEDAESLAVAIEVLKAVDVPDHKKDIEEVEKRRLLVVADENSQTYIEQWEESQGGVDANQRQMLLDQAREALDAVLADLQNPAVEVDREGDTKMEEDVVTIQLNADDELADIPAEMRETVAKEIASFRDRSNRRDLERLKMEEEMEREERRNGRRSPPPTAPSGPGVRAPTGPKGFPKDYQKGVTFVNGTGVSASSAFYESDASDEELEKRRVEAKKSEEEKNYLDQERRWLNRERSRTAAVEREKNRDTEEAQKLDSEKQKMAMRLKEWDDDTEASRKEEDYYRDRSLWIRNRMAFRQREQANDDADRADEDRDRRQDAHQDKDERMVDSNDHVDRDERSGRAEPELRREPARFTLKLGAAAQRQAADQAEKKRPVQNVENLLEAEEEEVDDRRKLIPIPQSQLDAAKAQNQDLSEEERAAAAKQLAAEIPTDKNALWAWDVSYAYLDNDVIETRLKPFVEKKIVEYLGVQEDMLVDVIIQALQAKKKPDELVKELEGALEEEEADALVRKLWRMVVFFSESGRRGLGA